MIPVVPYRPQDEQVRKAVDVAEAISRIQDRHQEYLEGKRLPLLPAQSRIQRDLTLLLRDSALGYSSDVADAAGLIVSALSEKQEMEKLPYLGQALVLVAQSQRGKTNEVLFHDVLSYLLATNGYTPVRMEEYYHGEEMYTFYADRSGEKIVAVGEKGCRVSCVSLKDEFRLDDLVDDFMNLNERTSRDVEGYIALKGISMFGSIAVGILAGPIVAIPFVSHDVSHSVSFLLCGFLLGGVGGYYGSKKWMEWRYNQRLEKARLDFPYTSLTKGVYALLDAFPIERNGVVRV